MAAGRKLGGVICPLLTPFDEDGRIDEASTRRLLDYVIDNGVQGVMLAGSTGEGLLLTPEERKRLADCAIQHVQGRVPVVIHVGCIDTATTVDLARHAAASGADALAAIVPFFFTYDDESLYAHFRRVAEAAPELPLFPYVFPGNAKNDIQPDLFRRLVADVPSIAGIKATNADLFQLREYCKVGAEAGDLAIFCGIDGLMLAGLVEGASGQISGNSNVFPQVVRRLYDAYQQGDLARARAQQANLDRMRAILRDGLHPAYMKAAIQSQGIIRHSTVRQPMRDLTPGEHAQLQTQLQEFEADLLSQGAAAG